MGNACSAEQEGQPSAGKRNSDLMQSQLDADTAAVEKKMQQDYLTKEKAEDRKRLLQAVQSKIVKKPYYEVYDEIEELGAGGFGVVYKMCKRSDPSSVFAVKVMKEVRNLADDPDTVREMNLMLSVDHPNLVKMYEVYEVPGQPAALVMELVEPGNDRYGDRMEQPDLMTILMNGRLDPTNTAKVIYQTADAINFLNHTCNAFHRDLKPDNILVGVEQFDRIRVSDYGQARIVKGGTDERVAATMNVGTDGYAAPETISTGKSVGVYDKKCDVWSLGVIMYMCCSGRPPFPLNNPTKARKMTLAGEYKAMEGKHWEGVPAEAKALISKMLVPNPAQRLKMEDVLQDPWLKKTAGK